MFEKTKKALASKTFIELFRITIPIDPAPLPDSEDSSKTSVRKALKEDLRSLFKKKENRETLK